MSIRLRICLFLCCLQGLFVLLPLPAAQAGGVADKSSYSLFRPTPRELLRELSTDRPDKTESPFTVDAGHFQFELDVVAVSEDRDRSGTSDLRTRSQAFAPLNAKVGLSPNVDLQVMIDTYQRVRIADRNAGTVQRRSGIGDLTTRVKVNLWGNDGDTTTALALMPFLKFPTNQDDLGNDAIEGGLIVPLAISLADGWGLGLMTELDVVRNADDDGHDVAWINSITFSRDIAGKLGGYVEFFSELSTAEAAQWIATLDLGLTYALSADMQLDAGINLGVTDAAEDWNPFVGISWRH